jgi:hypothetical protein
MRTLRSKYMLARIVFVFCYRFNVSGLRSTAWLVGMISAGIMMALRCPEPKRFCGTLDGQDKRKAGAG